MAQESKDLFGAMNTLDNYYLCSFPQFPINSINCLVLDTMVVNDLYAFVEGGPDSEKITPKVLDLIRKIAINANAGVMERSWQHQIDTDLPIREYFKPKGSDMAERLELLHFIKFSSNKDFESLKPIFDRLVRTMEPISSEVKLVISHWDDDENNQYIEIEDDLMDDAGNDADSEDEQVNDEPDDEAVEEEETDK